MKRTLVPMICLLVVALLAAGLAATSKLTLWWAWWAIITGAILVNGWMATLDDDLPGGFNNPDGTRTP